MFLCKAIDEDGEFDNEEDGEKEVKKKRGRKKKRRDDSDDEAGPSKKRKIHSNNPELKLKKKLKKLIDVVINYKDR